MPSRACITLFERYTYKTRQVRTGRVLYFMNEIIKEYLEWKGTYAPRASVSYKIWLDRFIEVCENKALESYDVADLIKYRKWLESRFGSYSVQFAIIVIKNFLQYCKTRNYSCLSPTLVKLPRVNAKSHRAVTENEYTKIISVIPTNEFQLLRDSLLIIPAFVFQNSAI